MEEVIKKELEKLKQEIKWGNQILSASKIEQKKMDEMILFLEENMEKKENVASSISREHISVDVFQHFLSEKTSGVNFAICYNWYETEKELLKQERKTVTKNVLIGLIMTFLSFGANVPAIKENIQNLLSMIPEDGIEKGLLSLALICALYTLRKLKQLEITDPDWQDIKKLEEEYLAFYSAGPKKKKSL